MSQLYTAPAQGDARVPDRAMPQRRRRDWFPFWMILPTALVLLAIQVFPALYTVWLSFQTYRPTGWQFVGLRNFQRLFDASVFGESISLTIIFLIGYCVLTLALGFIIALLLNYKTRLSGLYLTVIFIPWILADIIVGVVFRLMVLPDYGLFAGILQNPALIPPHGLSVLTDDAAAPWLAGIPFPPAPAMIYLILASVWRALPFTTLLLLAALQTIPHELNESATIDGANVVQSIRFITFPLILPVMVVSLFSLTLGGMNSVGMVFSLTNGGPGTATQVLSYLLYSFGWFSLDWGRAASLSLLIAIVNLVLIMGTLRITRVQLKE